MSIHPLKVTKYIIAALMLLFVPKVSLAVIGFNSVYPFSSGILPNSIFTLADCEGSNRLMTVGCIVPGLTVTAVNQNGTALTKATSIAPTGGEVSLWYLKAPATGNLTVVVTFSGNYTSANCGVICMTGVDQTAPLDAVASSSGNSTTASLNIVTVSTGAWAIDMVGNMGGSNVLTVGGSQVERWNSSGAGDDGAQSTLGPIATAGSTAMSWTQSSAIWGMCAASFKDDGVVATASGDPSMFLLMTGRD